MKKILFLFALLVVSSLSNAQNWRLFGRHEITVGLGPSVYFGDLGGNDQDGKNFLGSVSDINIPSTRYAVNLAYRYKLASNINFRCNLVFGRLSGSDTESENRFRKARNLSFRSPIVELGILGEYYFIKENLSMLDPSLAVGTGQKPGLSAYLVGGVATVYFNPQGLYQGQWYNLQPLGTEGQTVSGSGKQKYSRITPALVYGLGFKCGLSPKASIGIETVWRTAFTDYIDDVSTTYYDPAAIAQANGVNGAAAAYLSNPAKPEDVSRGYTEIGEVRGGGSNDAYFFTILTFSYKFMKTSTHLPKF